MDHDAEVGGEAVFEGLRGHDERGDAEGLGVDAEREVDHCRVARDGDLVDLRRVDGSLGARLEGKLVHCLVREVLELLEGGRIEHDGADAADDIGTERLLLVQHGCDSRRGAGRQVEEGRDDGRRAEVECDAEEPRGRIARLNGDEPIVDNDSGQLPVA